MKGRDNAIIMLVLAPPQCAPAPHRRYAVVRVTRRFRASPERVFDAWLDPEIAGKWLFATASRPMTCVTLDARVGGSFCFVDRQNGEEVARTGKYIEIVRQRRLVFTLRMENRPRVTAHVAVEIVTLKTGCELIVTHENVPPHCAVDTKNRWAGILYGLGETLREFSMRRDGSAHNGRTGSEGLREVRRLSVSRPVLGDNSGPTATRMCKATS
jgi:uncharacterized protein YndB with AHSA1/START domain